MKKKKKNYLYIFLLFLCLLRDFSLKLEDKKGNWISEKEYLKSALENKIGNYEIINENNRVRNSIKAYFLIGIVLQWFTR